MICSPAGFGTATRLAVSPCLHLQFHGITIFMVNLLTTQIQFPGLQGSYLLPMHHPRKSLSLSYGLMEPGASVRPS